MSRAIRSGRDPRRGARGAVALALLTLAIAVAAGAPGDAATRVVEKHANLDITRRVQARLAAAGIPVVMTRTSDRTVSLADRTRLANRRQVDAFVSIHNNASRNRSAGGSQVYHQIRGGPSRTLGALIRDRLARRPGLPSTLHARRGDHGDYYYVLRNTRMPAVIVEGAFVSNPREARLLASASFRQKLADAIAGGILAFQRTLTAEPLPSVVTPTRVAVPGVPGPTSPAGAAINARTVSLSWAPSLGAIGYNVYRDGVLLGAVDAAGLAGSEDRLAFVDRWAAPGQSYTYEVAAALPSALRAIPASTESTPVRVSVRTPPMVVALDAGHGGRDPGAVGGY